MSLQNLVAVAVSVAALAVSFVAYNKPAEFGGTEEFFTKYFREDAILGGFNFATSSQGAATYTAATFKPSKTITHTATGALTATLPASSTVPDFIPRTGDTATKFLLPVTNGITLAGGTGMDLNTASSTKFCVAGQVCRLDFVRKSNTDIEVLMTPVSGN